MQHHQVLPSQTQQPPAHHLQQQQIMLQQQQHALTTHHNGGPRGQTNSTYGSPQRRFLSEGELVRQSNELSYARTNNTVDNIRELANSPQKSMYMWKDNSPGYGGSGCGGGGNGHHPAQFPVQPNLLNRQLQSNQIQHDYQHNDPYHHRSNPTSPTQHMQYGGNNIGNNGTGPNVQAIAAAAIGQRYQQQQQQIQQQNNTNSQNGVAGGAYHPALRGGVPVFPPQPSPQIKRKATPTRPISFVRALEMTDSMEMTAMSGSSIDPQSQQQSHQQQQQLQQQNLHHQQQQQLNQSSRNNGPIIGSQQIQQQPNNLQRSTTPTPDRASVYDMNYEISV